MAHPERTATYRPRALGVTPVPADDGVDSYNIIPFSEDMLDHYTDSEIRTFVETSPHLVTTRMERTKKLSKNLLAKFVDGRTVQDELSAIQHAREKGIRVPTVRRVVNFYRGALPSAIVIMERIHGYTLEELWAKIGWWKTVQLAVQLKRFVRIMHADASTTTGGLSTGMVRSPHLDGLYPPASHSSPAAFTGYLNWWLLNCRPKLLKPRPDLCLEPSPKHVFAHLDLVARNIVIDAQNQLWIVDWGFAGYYPKYMEYIRMEAPSTSSPYASWSARFARWRWMFLRYIVMGPASSYSQPCRALWEVYRRSSRFRLERALNSEDTE